MDGSALIQGGHVIFNSSNKTKTCKPAPSDGPRLPFPTITIDVASTDPPSRMGPEIWLAERSRAARPVHVPHAPGRELVSRLLERFSNCRPMRPGMPTWLWNKLLGRQPCSTQCMEGGGGEAYKSMHLQTIGPQLENPMHCNREQICI